MSVESPRRSVRAAENSVLFIPQACALPGKAVSGTIDMVHDDTANLITETETAAQPTAPTVAIVVVEGVTLFGLAAAHDVFGTEVTTSSGAPLYQVVICG